METVLQLLVIHALDSDKEEDPINTAVASFMVQSIGVAVGFLFLVGKSEAR
jgi:hypothetical protein